MKKHLITIIAVGLLIVMNISIFRSLSENAHNNPKNINLFSSLVFSSVFGQGNINNLSRQPDKQGTDMPQIINPKSSPTGELAPVSFSSTNYVSISVNLNNLLSLKIQSSPNFLNPLAPHDVVINLVGSKQINLSAPIVLSGNLKDITTGTGIANKSIKFYTNGLLLAQTHTNSDGTYQVKINKNLPAGKYEVTAKFTGAHLLAAAATNFSLDILPATIRVQTVPAIAGIPFQMDGKKFVSGQDGIASVQIDQVGDYQLEVLLDQYSSSLQRIGFGRWTEETYQTSRMVKVPNNSIVQVGLNVYHKVSFKFVDLSNYPIDPSRISSITIRSVQGDFFTLKPGDTPWLPAIRTARRQTGLEETNLLYSIDSVTIDGSNVVNSAQQRFFAKADDTWEISTLLYSMHITAKDAMLRTPVGTSVNIVFPNGQINNYPLDSSGALDLHALARGIYHVNLVGVQGLGTSSPVALSRNQVVNLKIVTRMDMILFMATSGGFALGLVIYGRPWLLQFFSRKKHHRFYHASKDFGA
jgi:hypothetical protein